MSHAEEEGYELAVPFLPVQSLSGPFEDAAYAAGWEMGALQSVLAGPKALYRGWVFEENREQVDLLAMRHGYSFDVTEEADGYVHIELSPTIEGAS